MPALLPRFRVLAVPFFALALGGCELPLDWDDDVGGWYSYAGTVHDEPGFSVNGELYISRGYGSSAYADVEWHMLEGSQEIMDIRADDVPVDTDWGDHIRFTIEGDLQMADGRWRQFRLEHEGELNGRTMKGTWELHTDVPSTDSGRFSASR